MVKAEAVRGGRETILVVEDEVSLLRVLCSVLQSFEYNVLVAVSGAARGLVRQPAQGCLPPTWSTAWR